MYICICISLFMYIYIYMHTYIYIYIYISILQSRELGRDRDRLAKLALSGGRALPFDWLVNTVLGPGPDPLFRGKAGVERQASVTRRGRNKSGVLRDGIPTLESGKETVSSDISDVWSILFGSAAWQVSWGVLDGSPSLGRPHSSADLHHLSMNIFLTFAGEILIKALAVMGRLTSTLPPRGRHPRLGARSLGSLLSSRSSEGRPDPGARSPSPFSLAHGPGSVVTLLRVTALSPMAHGPISHDAICLYQPIDIIC